MEVEMPALGCKLGLSEVDGNAAEPGEHRTAAEGDRVALELYAAEYRDERDLIALGIAT
jgi:hypothetical protein